MNITFVIDLYGDTTNGTTITCMRTAKALMKLGHKVSIIAYVPKNHIDLKDTNILMCDHYKVPIFDKLILANGMAFATASEKDIANFVKDSDIVHLFLTYTIEIKVKRVCNVLNIPVTSAFHCQPENVSYNLKLGKIKLVNDLIYRIFNNLLYKYTRHIHTPSEMMKDQMIMHHYKNKIHAISNGVDPRFVPTHFDKPADLKDKYVILMTGRYSAEKRQDLIFKAIGHSKYNDKIQLILCGKGPLLKKYQKMSKKYLKNPCRFGFLNQDELFKTINTTDLYIHASDAESEAISCIEAFSCGIVPVISDSKVSATNHFALDKRCLFKAGNYKSLQEKIEYFIEHPEEKEKLSKKYADYGKTFCLENCAKKLESMFYQEIEDHKRDVANNTCYYMNNKERRKLKKVAKILNVELPSRYLKNIKQK